MAKALDWWRLHPAAWWEFWYPQSGMLGGFLTGSLIMYVLVEMSR